MIVTLTVEQKEVVNSMLTWKNQAQSDVVRILLQALAKNTEELEVQQDIVAVLKWWNKGRAYANWGVKQHLAPDYKVAQDLHLNEEDSYGGE